MKFLLTLPVKWGMEQRGYCRIIQPSVVEAYRGQMGRLILLGGCSSQGKRG